MQNVTITVYLPDGTPIDYQSNDFGFQEKSGALKFTDTNTNKLIITTLPYIMKS